LITLQGERSMTTDQACATLAEWLRADPRGHAALPAFVVCVTSDGLVCETPLGFTADEARALAGWVRAATK